MTEGDFKPYTEQILERVGGNSDDPVPASDLDAKVGQDGGRFLVDMILLQSAS
jgi:hypothetical protein